MKKTGIEIKKLLNEFISIKAVAQCSPHDFEVDMKIDTLARKVLRCINDTVGDEIDAINGLEKKIYEKLRLESRKAKKPDVEYNRLIEADLDLPKLRERYEDLIKTTVDFEYQPVTITSDQRKEAYNSIPDDKVQQIEWKTTAFKAGNIHNIYRELLANKWLVIEGSEEDKEAKTTTVKTMEDVKKITRNRN